MSGDGGRTLVAGVGNVLRGDDGFGIELLRIIEREPRPSVRFFEAGIAGIGLVQELMDGFDALVILDALERGAEPGTLWVLEPDTAAIRAAVASSNTAAATDLHQADPEAVLTMAAALGVLPDRVWIVGCQPVECDELGFGLSEPVRAQIPAAAERVRGILEKLTTPAKSLKQIDEVLQVMFWLRGEGLAADVAAEDLGRWTQLTPVELGGLFARMETLGQVERVPEAKSARYRLTQAGTKEGGRRFADEFQELTKPGHGECGDKDCDCHRTGRAEDCKHRLETSPGGHGA